jgi:hypothetical protein
MRVVLTAFLALSMAACGGTGLTSVMAVSQDAEHRKTLATVNRVHLQPFGRTEAAERFALILEQELIDQGFSIASSPDSADITLSGIVSMDWRIDSVRANATIRGVSRNGERIWGGTFPPPVFMYPTSDAVKKTAISVVNQLRYDVDQLRKAAAAAR